MHVRIAIVALLLGCGGKTVHENPIPPDEPTPIASPSGTSASDPVPDPVPAPTNPACDVTLARDVMPIFVASNCTASSCHGGEDPPNPPRIDPDDPVHSRAALVWFWTSSRQQYVVPGAPERSGIFCNLASGDTCGTHMPLGGQLTGAELTIIRKWVACGAVPGWGP